MFNNNYFPMWFYKNNEFVEIPEGVIGFVYLITNTQTGKQYFGKKNFYRTLSKIKTVTLKSGIKKKKKVKVTSESDWKTYFGSSEDVQRDVKEYGADIFRREIIRLCISKGELSYYEAKFQIENDVLLFPEKYYNSWISLKVHRSHLTSIRGTM